MNNEKVHPVFNQAIYERYERLLEMIEDSEEFQEIRKQHQNFSLQSSEELQRDITNAEFFSINLLENISLK